MNKPSDDQIEGAGFREVIRRITHENTQLLLAYKNAVAWLALSAAINLWTIVCWMLEKWL